MEGQKKARERRSYEPDFKAEILKMLLSGKKVSEISETFGIAENVLYRWKTVSKMKTKTKSTESESSVNLLAEIAKLKAENAQLKTDREILKKARRAAPLGLLSSSD